MRPSFYRVAACVVSAANPLVAQEPVFPGWRFVSATASAPVLRTAPDTAATSLRELYARDSLWVVRCRGDWCAVASGVERRDTMHIRSADLVTRDQLAGQYLIRGWSAVDLHNVMRRRVVLGMNPDLVVEAWGWPDSATQVLDSTGIGMVFRYASCAAVELRARRVTAVRDCVARQRAEVKRRPPN